MAVMRDGEDDGLKGMLSETLKATTDWLKFAEAKNAALIGVNLAVLVTSEKIQSAIGWATYFHWVSGLCIISISIALLSVIPRVGWPLPSMEKNNRDEHDNLMFYGDVAKYSPGGYCGELSKKFGRSLTKTEDWTARQVAVLSDLTLQKLSFFKLAAFITLSAVATPIGAALLYCARSPRRVNAASDYAKTMEIVDPSEKLPAE
jgi:hypothetical protein